MENIVSFFQKIVNERPDETAVIFEGKGWTYRELDVRSDRIAAFLMGQPVKGRQVGVAMERGQEWIIALLGLWKAGGVYVPLDLNHPHERLESILVDCEVFFVICSRGEGFKPDHVPFSYVDEMLYGEQELIRYPLPSGDDRAYIIYTSGTSGEPKGIPTCHRQAVRMSRIAREKFFYVQAGESLLQLAGLNFSASLVEILTALLNGVCLVMASDEERRDPRLLVELIEREQVLSAIIPPALLAVFPKVPLEGLKTLLVAGEGVAADVKDFWMKGRRMVNAYGFTENTVLVASGIYTEGTPANDIGTLVPDSVAYVLDEDLNLVPDGMSGELCIGGSQLTEGYWKRPELNAQKFIKNPFLAESEHEAGHCRWLYRSGDRVTHLSNGHYLYVGRLDNQVKIRGMRIELSEVEQCLNRYQGVSLSVVLAKERQGRKVLVAYLQAEQEIDKDKIATFVADRLPDYMRPTYYVCLASFPMTINRKIDRNQLPEPDWDYTEEKKEEPVTPTEKEIARIWHEMLGVSVIGRYDNFISLGGDSISVFLMTNILERYFGLTLKVEEVFSRLDLNMLSQLIERSMIEKRGRIKKIPHTVLNVTCPLSPALRNLWSQCVSSEEVSEAYKLAIFLPWDTGLKVDLLQKAWNRILREQEAMRISFPLGGDGKPYIQVAPFVYTDIPIRDTEKDTFLAEAYPLYHPPVLLDKGPLHRACLYRFPDGEYCLVVVIHHLVTDGWSLRLLNEMLCDYYRQEMRGYQSPVETCSYRDYVVWCEEQLDRLTVEERKLFWKRYLSGCSDLHFEGMEERNTPLKKQGGAKYIRMESELARQLDSFCERHAVTPLVACLSVFQLLLVKYTGQTDFAVGLAATDRRRPEFQDVLGYFATLLPVRVLKSEKDGFGWYTRKMMEEVVNLLSNSLPLHLISPILRFAFGMEKAPSEIDVPERWITSSPFDMALIIHKHKGDYSFHFQYATSCFDEKSVVRFCESFQVALRFLIKEPSRDVMECPLLPKSEILKRMFSFHFSKMILPMWSVIERFQEIVRENPDREAYRWADIRVSYGELDDLSDRLAVSIREKLVGRGEGRKALPVGVYLKEKRYLLPALIGVLKSGGCYVPLDTTLPTERLAFMLEDAGVLLALIDEPLPAALACETLSIKDGVEKKPQSRFYPAKLAAKDTAYIIYTSGTSGKPKGIPISHRSLALFASSQAEIYRLSPDKRVLQYASVGFDASVMEIFPALITKASLVIPTEEERKDSHLLLDLIEKEKVYCALIPPALLSVLPYRALPDLRTLLVGGESTPSDVMERWGQDRRFINAYGPTENTVVTTCLEMTADCLPNDIGYPLPGVSCYVLDKHMTLLPDYVPGELYIGGLQLTTGYINRQELNREKFVDNPFVCRKDKRVGRNTRLYKSGDKVMRTAEGTFLFLGRMDSQVKLRGFRIELEEIERQIQEYPGIAQAVVVLRESGEEKRIAAYLLTVGTKTVEVAKVRKFLISRLPAYMIPSAWLLMENFPLTVNGKVDRKALPEPELLLVEEYEPPMNQEEEVLARIAAGLLQVPRIGVYTDLLAMGLTSLQVMEMIQEARKEKVTVSVTDVYKGRCLRDILMNRGRSSFYWGNEPITGKPVVVLVCGYPSFKPFYDRFVERFSDDYSFFVFESFLDYFRGKEVFRASDLVDYYKAVLEKELAGLEIYAVAGHCLGGELGLLLAERLRTDGHPSIKALVIECFIRRDKSLLVPLTIENALLREQGRITNGVIESMPELSFGGEMIVCLASKGSERFMFETEGEDNGELIRKMWAASRKNQVDWGYLYPRIPCYRLDTDHWGVFDKTPLTTLYEIVRNNWH